jgi:hypothetical protein
MVSTGYPTHYYQADQQTKPHLKPSIMVVLTESLTRVHPSTARGMVKEQCSGRMGVPTRGNGSMA